MKTKSIGLRISQELFDYLTERAANENRTLSNMIVTIITKEKENDHENEKR